MRECYSSNRSEAKCYYSKGISEGPTWCGAGKFTIQFIHEVARFIADKKVHFRPSQLLDGLSILSSENMTTEHIDEHLVMLSEWPLKSDDEMVKHATELQDIAEWLTMVDPIPMTTRTNELTMERAGGPELMM